MACRFFVSVEVSPENVEKSGNSRNEENGREYTIEEGKHDITL